LGFGQCATKVNERTLATALQRSPGLQIASAEHAFLVDLLALSSEPRLDQVLTQLFRSEAAVKLSMDASQDFKKLAGRGPQDLNSNPSQGHIAQQMHASTPVASVETVWVS